MHVNVAVKARACAHGNACVLSTCVQNLPASEVPQRLLDWRPDGGGVDEFFELV
jgi:hypothetical protein